MARTVLGAVADKLKSVSAITTAATGGVWSCQAPRTKVPPLVVIEHKGEEPEWTAENDYVETTSLSVHCLAPGCDDAESLALDVKDAIDWQQLTVTSCSCLQVQRVGYTVSAEKDKNASADFVFHATTDYEIRIRRTLTNNPVLS